MTTVFSPKDSFLTGCAKYYKQLFNPPAISGKAHWQYYNITDYNLYDVPYVDPTSSTGLRWMHTGTECSQAWFAWPELDTDWYYVLRETTLYSEWYTSVSKHQFDTPNSGNTKSPFPIFLWNGTHPYSYYAEEGKPYNVGPVSLATGITVEGPIYGVFEYYDLDNNYVTTETFRQTTNYNTTYSAVRAGRWPRTGYVRAYIYYEWLGQARLYDPYMSLTNANDYPPDYDAIDTHVRERSATQHPYRSRTLLWNMNGAWEFLSPDGAVWIGDDLYVENKWMVPNWGLYNGGVTSFDYARDANNDYYAVFELIKITPDGTATRMTGYFEALWGFYVDNDWYYPDGDPYDYSDFYDYPKLEYFNEGYLPLRVMPNDNSEDLNYNQNMIVSDGKRYIYKSYTVYGALWRLDTETLQCKFLFRGEVNQEYKIDLAGRTTIGAIYTMTYDDDNDILYILTYGHTVEHDGSVSEQNQHTGFHLIAYDPSVDTYTIVYTMTDQAMLDRGSLFNLHAANGWEEDENHIYALSSKNPEPFVRDYWTQNLQGILQYHDGYLYFPASTVMSYRMGLKGSNAWWIDWGALQRVKISTMEREVLYYSYFADVMDDASFVWPWRTYADMFQLPNDTFNGTDWWHYNIQFGVFTESDLGVRKALNHEDWELTVEGSSQVATFYYPTGESNTGNILSEYWYFTGAGRTDEQPGDPSHIWGFTTEWRTMAITRDGDLFNANDSYQPRMDIWGIREGRPLTIFSIPEMEAAGGNILHRIREPIFHYAFRHNPADEAPPITGGGATRCFWGDGLVTRGWFVAPRSITANRTPTSVRYGAVAGTIYGGETGPTYEENARTVLWEKRASEVVDEEFDIEVAFEGVALQGYSSQRPQTFTRSLGNMVLS